MSDQNRPAIAVVGSLNIDYFAKVAELPSPGETVGSTDLTLHYGGKGANQSIACARQGAEVFLIGAVGGDEEGRKYLEVLAGESGLSLESVRTAEGRTGSAFITVDQRAENTIVTAAGANAQVTVTSIQENEAKIRSCAAVLAQLEVPIPSVVEAARIANDAGIPFLLNPSPVSDQFPWQEVRTDYLIVNEGEAEVILEFPPLEEEESVVRQRLHELRIETMVVTRGGDETLCYSRNADPLAVETLPVLPVDTVGAGDAFAGCFAARIAGGEDVESALRAGNCAGALTTLGSGAQDPIPDREKVEQHLEHLRATTS